MMVCWCQSFYLEEVFDFSIIHLPSYSLVLWFTTSIIIPLRLLGLRIRKVIQIQINYQLYEIMEKFSFCLITKASIPFILSWESAIYTMVLPWLTSEAPPKELSSYPGQEDLHLNEYDDWNLCCMPSQFDTAHRRLHHEESETRMRGRKLICKLLM